MECMQEVACFIQELGYLKREFANNIFATYILLPFLSRLPFPMRSDR